MGDEATVDYYEGALPQAEPVRIERRTVAADVAERAAAWRWPGDAATARLSVPPAAVREALAAAGAGAVADPAHGIVLMPGVTVERAAAVGYRGVHLDGDRLTPLGLRPVEQAVVDRVRAAIGG